LAHVCYVINTMKTYTIVYTREVEQRITVEAVNETDAIQKSDCLFSQTRNLEDPFDQVPQWSISAVFET